MTLNNRLHLSVSRYAIATVCSWTNKKDSPRLLARHNWKLRILYMTISCLSVPGRPYFLPSQIATFFTQMQERDSI
jgi:hypothetical protein